MPHVPRPGRPHRPARPARPGRPRRTGGRGSGEARIIVLGDLMVDVVLTPARALETGTDVPGQVRLVPGGSAANTARWLGRLGARTGLIAAVGRDAFGRALIDVVRADGVVPHVTRVRTAPTGRIGVLVAPDGERSFVADRGAADRLESDDLRATWFSGLDALHLPAYSLLAEPLGTAGRRAVALAREAGGAVSVDLASVGPLLAGGRKAAHDLVREIAPDLLFATAAEAEALLGTRTVDGLLELAPMAVVKRGSKGATVVARIDGERVRLEVATEPLPATDTTGAGDAFDAGFLVGWFAARVAGSRPAAALRRAAVAGHKAAARQIGSARTELPIG